MPATEATADIGPNRADADITAELGDDLLAGVTAEVEDHLRFACRVLSEAQLDPTKASDLTRRIALIRKRGEDPSLYLAVVGAFSCGKSTFINALLRERLLSSAVLATTAASTHLVHGSSPGLNVEFRTDSADAGHDRDARPTRALAEIAETIGRLRGTESPAADLREILPLLTADHAVASHVSRVTVEHPSPLLADGIVVIDTPGLNADVDGHDEVTRRVVEEEADVAVVLIPADQPLASTTRLFLEQHLQESLHRCVFVITKMDDVPPREAERVVEFVERRLERFFGLDRPQVLPAAARLMIPGETPDGVDPGRAEQWQNRFSALEAALWERLRRERSLSITESVLRLLTGLMDELESAVETERDRCLADARRLEENAIRDMPSFVAELRSELENELGQAHGAVRTELMEKARLSQRDSRDAVRARLFDAEDKAALADVLDAKIPAILDKRERQLDRALGRALQRADEAAERAAEKIDDRLAEHYRKLRRIRRRELRSGGKARRERGPGKGTRPQAAAWSLRSSRRGGPRATGALIGALAGGPVGLVIWDAIGAQLSRLFGASLDERKTQIWKGRDGDPGLTGDLRKHYRRSRSRLEKAFDRHCAARRSWVLQHLEAYVGRYTETVEGLIRDQAEEREALRGTVAMTNDHLAGLAARRERLRRCQEALLCK